MTENAIQKTRKSEPTQVIEVGGRKALSKGGWRQDGVATYLMDERHKYHTVGDLARLAFGGNCKATRTKVRARLPKLRSTLALQYGELLVTEFGGGYGAATAVKIYDRSSETDRHNMRLFIERLDAQSDRMAAYYRRVTGLLFVDRQEAA